MRCLRQQAPIRSPDASAPEQPPTRSVGEEWKASLRNCAASSIWIDKLVKPTFGLGTICEARRIEVDGGVAGSVHNDMAWHDDPRCQTAVCRPRH